MVSRPEHGASKLAKKYDGVFAGYVPLQISPLEHNATANLFKYPGGIKGSTVAEALKPLNFPHRLLNQPYRPMTCTDVNACTKLSFLIKTLKGIQNKECNLDVAIVASTRQTETAIVNALNLYNFQYKPLSQCFDNEPPVVGALVRFRKAKTADRAPNFKLTVDYIITYDLACIVDRNFIEHFRGVYYTRPKVASLVCERTPDLRICNYRDKHPNKTVNGTTSMEDPKFDFMALFYSVVYPKIMVVDRAKANMEVSKQLVTWMVGKEDIMFYPSRPSCLPRPSAVVSTKRRTSAMSDAADSSPPSKKRAGPKLPDYSSHPVTDARLALLKSRIQTSFPLKQLSNPSLILHVNVLRGVDWLSGTRLINTRKKNTSGSEVKSTSHSGNVAPISHTPSPQSSTSSAVAVSNPSSAARKSPVAPSIHPSRLAMIEASQQRPSPSLSSPIVHTQNQEPHHTHISNPNQTHDEPETLAQTDDATMHTEPEGSVDTEMIPQESTEEDYISLNGKADDTMSDSPMDRQDSQEGSVKSTESSPQTEQVSSNNALDEFEVALERAHLELMRSLLGKGDDE